MNCNPPMIRLPSLCFRRWMIPLAHFYSWCRANLSRDRKAKRHIDGVSGIFTLLARLLTRAALYTNCEYALGLLVFLLTTAGCSSQRADRFQWDPPEFRVKGTYYFQPKAAINNFWTSLDWGQAEADFARLREDGFNTIILFIPWGLFQPTVSPITYNEQAFQELDQLLQIADAFALKVVLRVGTHDHIPRDATGEKWLAGTVLADDAEWAAYRHLFREVAARTKSHSNLLFLFWTFEDTGYSPDLWFHQYPANVEAFRNWLRRRPLWWWNLLWWENNASYEAIVPPNLTLDPQKALEKDSFLAMFVLKRKLRAFFEFADELLARRLPEACAAAKQGNSNVIVSFQPRPEINWDHDFSLQFELPPCYSFVTTWFSPYQSYLFGDERKELDGKTIASYIPRYLERTERLSNGLPVFIDQFNFQHFGGDPEEGALTTAQEQLDFVAYSLPVLLQDSLGYALWNYFDYYLNVVSDGFFRFGFQEWETPSDQRLVAVLPAQNQENPEIEIQPGGFLRQNISVYPDTEYTLEFLAGTSRANARGNVLIRFQPADGLPDLSIPLRRQIQPYSRKVKIPPDTSSIAMTFSPPEGGPAIRIKEILFYPWIDTGGIYDVEGQPRTELRDLFRRLNASVP